MAAFSKAATVTETISDTESSVATPKSNHTNDEYRSNSNSNDIHLTPPRNSPSGEASPAHKKSTSQTATTTTTIQFAPSSAVEFHPDALVHEWRVLEDAAERFPTTGERTDENDDDNDDEEERISEATWAALFAMEREEQNGKHNTHDNDDDDDEEDSLDGSLGRLMAPVVGDADASSTTNNNNARTLPRQSSELSLLSEDSERSLMNASYSSSNTNTSPVVCFSGFNEGFRMNSDQSLGLHSVASSSSCCGATSEGDTDAQQQQSRSLLMGLSTEHKGSRNILRMSSWREEEDDDEHKNDKEAAAAVVGGGGTTTTHSLE